MRIKSSEMPLKDGGKIYHLNLISEELGDTVILVGDPDRVESVSKRFDSITVKRQNRELVTHSGLLGGKSITALSTGMGTDNIDIVINELDALANVDLNKGVVNAEHKSLNLIRIGTCGIVQPDIPLESYIVSEFGFGFDGLLHFYQHGDIFRDDIADDFVKQTNWDDKLPYPYCVPADDHLLKTIGHDMTHGITASAPGFYGPQGREIRAKVRFPDLKKRIEMFRYDGLRIMNLEMECSAIYGLGKLLGHKTLTVCVGIANRFTGDFTANYQPAMDKLIDTVLERTISC
ncbi:nucleoside phosphorylase [Bacteroidales bacterium OttesenSCG-928-B11]|nr:nucleoside phosphorylase [Bacteroidales bacterium OttesenSCG-928-E04]MDL2311351.1 nucleoside phosphorylase [Bacteroidales bacterium OttesenSCG-928-B11]